MRLPGFRVEVYPNIPASEGVYVVGIAKEGGVLPMYVGQTSTMRRRYGDYLVAIWHAPTDFVVGTAVRHIQDRGFQAVYAYKGVMARRSEEKALIQAAHQGGYHLLNGLVGYDYKSASREAIERQVKVEVDKIINT